MAQMTKAQLVDENIRLRAHIDHLEQRIAALNAECEARVTEIVNLKAGQSSAQRSVQGAPVRMFRNADGVLMGKFPIGHNRFAIRPVEAA